MLGLLFTALFLLCLFFCILTGRETEAAGALLQGAQEALPFCLSLAGGICFWSALMELAERCGLAARLAKALHPILCKLFPQSAAHRDILSALAENLSANLLGLGNAATPAGIRAAKGMARLGAAAQDELALLVVVNTASLQLVPGTVAAVRASAGAASPFDIMPAVWLSSLFSVAAGLSAAAIFRRLWPCSR